MKKETYLRKLASTEITDDNTVGEAKAAKKTETELKRFWRTSALEHIRANEADSDVKLDNPLILVDMTFNLKPNGSIVVKLLNGDRGLPYPPFHPEVKSYTIPKRLFLV